MATNDYSLMVDATEAIEDTEQSNEVPKVNFKIGDEAPTELQLSFVQKRNFEIVGDDEDSFIILERNVTENESIEETDNNATIVENTSASLNDEPSSQDKQEHVEKTVQEEEVSKFENLSSLQQAILTVCNQQAEKCDSTKLLLNRLMEQSKNLRSELSSCSASVVDFSSTTLSKEKSIDPETSNQEESLINSVYGQVQGTPILPRANLENKSDLDEVIQKLKTALSAEVEDQERMKNCYENTASMRSVYDELHKIHKTISEKCQENVKKLACHSVHVGSNILKNKDSKKSSYFSLNQENIYESFDLPSETVNAQNELLNKSGLEKQYDSISTAIDNDYLPVVFEKSSTNVDVVPYNNECTSIKSSNGLDTKDQEVKILTEINQTLAKHVQTLEKNAFPGIVINVCSDPQHSNLFQSLQDSSISNSMGVYNEICNELGTSFASMNSCYGKVHDILMECTKIIQAFENLKFFVTCSSSNNNEITSFKNELNDYRQKLLEEQVQIIDSKQIVTKSVRGFDKIWAYCVELERELALQKDELIKMKINYDKKTGEGNKQLSKQYEDLNEEKLKLEKEKTILEEERQKFSAEKSSMKSELECLMADQRELDLEKEKLADERQKLDDERKRLENLRLVLDQQQQRLPAERLAFHQQIQTLYHQNNVLIEQIQSLKQGQAESVQRETTIAELNKSLYEEIQSGRIEISNMRQFNENLSSRCQVLSEQIVSLKQEQAESVQKETTVTQLNKSLQEEIQSGRIEMSNLRHLTDNLSSRCQALSEQVESLKREQAESLQEETANTELNKSLLEEIQSNRIEMSNLRQFNDNLSSKCQVLEADIDHFNKELVACHRTISELRKKYADSEAKIEELKFESEERGRKLNELMSEEKNYLETIESLYNENNRLIEQQAENC